MLGHVGPMLGHLGAHLGPSWGYVGAGGYPPENFMSDLCCFFLKSKKHRKLRGFSGAEHGPAGGGRRIAKATAFGRVCPSTGPAGPMRGLLPPAADPPNVALGTDKKPAAKCITHASPKQRASEGPMGPATIASTA